MSLLDSYVVCKEPECGMKFYAGITRSETGKIDVDSLGLTCLAGHMHYYTDSDVEWKERGGK